MESCRVREEAWREEIEAVREAGHQTVERLKVWLQCRCDFRGHMRCFASHSTQISDPRGIHRFLRGFRAQLNHFSNGKKKRNSHVHQ